MPEPALGNEALINALSSAKTGRLISSLQPTGKLFSQDDFEASLLKWGELSYLGGMGGGVVLDPTHALHGNQCLEIRSGITSGGGYQTSRDFGQLPKNRIGMEFWFLPEGTITQFMFGFELRTGTRLIQALIYKYHQNDWHVRRGISLNVDQLARMFNYVPNYVDTAREAVRFYPWHHVKLVADLDLEKYVSFNLDHLSYNVKPFNTYTETYTLDPNTLHFFIFWWNNVGVTLSSRLRIDDAIFTCEEP
jgi:hypothetical protein